ncbi:tetratricopeptide repeat protein [Candidatus Parcubacteria bacterium]|nr:tetratricopeptide repeat protein [Candidatus Parcubacteria bacterium]
MIFVALSVLFSSFKFLPPASPEIGVPLSEILKVTLFSLKEKPFFGQGPLAFNFNYLKWGSIFGERLFVPHFFILASSLGIFGFLFYFIFLLFPLFWGIKFWNNFSQETLFLPVFFGLFGFVLAQFFYPFSFSLYFSFFLFLGIFANLTSKKEITFSLHNFYFTFLALIVLVFVFWSSILAGKSLLSEYFYFKGLLSWRDGNLEKTIEFLTKAYNLNPKIDYYSRDLAQAFLAKANQKVAKNDFNILDEVKRSIELSKEATENNPLNSANFAVKAFVYHSLAGIVKGAEEAGIKSWQETIEREPRNPYYWTQKGILHLRLAILGEDKEENFQKAEDSFKKALEIVPDYAPARFQMAVLSQAKGEIEKAIAQLEETKLISPFDVGVKFQLGVLYYQKKDYEKAKKELEEAITLFPDYSNALYFLGLTLDALGQKEEAIKKFERVAQLNPEVKEIQQIIENLKQGKPALEGIGQSVPPTTPIESAPAEIKK